MSDTSSEKVLYPAATEGEVVDENEAQHGEGAGGAGKSSGSGFAVSFQGVSSSSVGSMKTGSRIGMSGRSGSQHGVKINLKGINFHSKLGDSDTISTSSPVPNDQLPPLTAPPSFAPFSNVKSGEPMFKRAGNSQKLEKPFFERSISLEESTPTKLGGAFSGFGKTSRKTNRLAVQEDAFSQPRSKTTSAKPVPDLSAASNSSGGVVLTPRGMRSPGSLAQMNSAANAMNFKSPLGSLSPSRTLSGFIANKSSTTTRLILSDEEWKEKLSKKEYQVLRERTMEAPYQGKYTQPAGKDGIFLCKACENPLFSTRLQKVSSSGWATFSDAFPKRVNLLPKVRENTETNEILCSKCDGFIGLKRQLEASDFEVNCMSLKFRYLTTEQHQLLLKGKDPGPL